MAQFQFLRGNYTNLPAKATEGTTYWTYDGTILLGLADGSYKEYGNVTSVTAVANLPESAPSSMLYYCEAENVLAKYNKDTSAWIQINLDTDTTYVISTGSKAGSIKLTGTNKKGVQVSEVEIQIADIEALEASIVETKTAVDSLSEKVGTVSDGTTVMDEVSQNATDIADLKAIVSAMTGDGEDSVGSIAEAITAHIETLDVEDTEVEGQFVVAVSETDGIIVPTRRALKASDIPVIEQAQVNGLADTIADAKKAGTDAQTSVETLTNKVGEVAEGKTVVEMITDAQTAATYDDTQVKTDIKINADAIAAIVADYLKKADKDELLVAIATAKSEAIATVLGEGVDEKYDTLVEVANWILADTTNSAELVAKVNAIEADYLKAADKEEIEQAINDLETFVGTLPETATSTTVVAYIQEVIDALKIGDYAKATDLTALSDRVKAIEDITSVLGDLATLDEVTEDVVSAELMAKINAAAEGNHSHANKEVLDSITAELVTQWNDAYAKAHEHENKDELDLIASGDVAKWNASEQNAMDYTDEVVEGLANVYEAKGSAQTAEDNAKAYTDSALTWGEF